jgi:phage gpG-like protein
MPAPLKINVDVVGDRLAAERLLQLGERAADMRPVKPLLDPVFHEDEQHRFDMDGPGWRPLAAATRELKKQHGWDARILRRTGELERSLTQRGEELEPSRMGPRDELAFGTTVPYARFHQYGQGVPRRELINLMPRTVERMTAISQDYIVEGPRP